MGSGSLGKTWLGGRDGVAVEVEGDCAVDVGAVDADSGVLQAFEDIGFGKAERVSVSD